MGRPDVDAMLEEMTAHQLRDWRLFYDIDPWGEQRADMRLSVLMRAILAPWTKANIPLPSPVYPYESNGVELAPEAPPDEQLAWLEEYVAELEKHGKTRGK